MKSKKIIIGSSVLLATATAIATPIAINQSKENSALQHNDSQNTSNPNIKSFYKGSPGALAAKKDKNKSLYDGTQVIIDDSKAFNYIENDKANVIREEGKWYNDYLIRRFSDYDIKVNYNFASKNGWTEETYLKYLKVKYELFGQSKNNVFGLVAKTSQDWIAWHRGEDAAAFVDGHGSPVKPSWEGAEKVKSNGIDNSLKWFAYDQGISTFFTFDQNNLGNAWKRLEFMKRIIPTSIPEIKAETDAHKTKKTKFIVDGKLIESSKLDPFKHYFYVTSNGSDFVRDTNGWKIIVSDDNYEKSFTTVLNPTITDASYPQNVDFPKSRLINPDKTKKDIDEAYWDGKYTITHSANSFSNLTKDPTFFFPREYSTSSQGTYTNQFGRVINDAAHYWEGGGFSWAYVEDGKGGHKIYKKINVSTDKKDLFGKFYGNWHHLFPVQEWFEKNKAIWKDRGFN